ncbi:MAG: tetratricopeptide repeat-containing sensor histidine kinase [Ferruginibacter sp.]|nr:tetratricopeptide repeat-containing sensor histidine kinase [Chitinophagaceae bacterium]
MKIISFAAIFLVALNTFAQTGIQAFTDSLIKEIPLTKNDTTKAKLYKTIVDTYIDNNPAIAMQYAETGLKHVTMMKWNKGIAVFYILKGNLYNDQGEYAKAIDLFNKSYLIHTANKDTFNAASALNNMGTAYLRQSVFEKAAENYFKAMKLAESINNHYLTALCLNNIGLTYFNQNDYVKALEYQHKALTIYVVENNKDGMADNYVSIGSTHLQKKDTLNARKYYEDAVALYKQTNNHTGEAIVYTNLSILIPDHAVRLDYKVKAQEIWDNLNPAHTTSLSNMGNIALSYLDIARYDSLHKVKASAIIPATRTGLLQKAEEYLDRAAALSIQTGDMVNFTFLTGLLAELEAEKGNFKKAYYDARAFHKLSDSVYSQENKNKIATIEGQREVALRDKEIELNKLALSAQKKLRTALTAGILLLCFIGALLYRQSTIRKKTNTTLIQLNTELDEANKVKAKFFAILSHDLRSPVANLVNFLHLKKAEPGLLSAEQSARHQQKITSSAETLLENMETMLLWSKGQMDHFKPVKKLVPVGDLFNQLEKTFATLTEIPITFINPENVAGVTDEDFLYTIMHNLTTNAVKALAQITGASIEWKAWKVKDDIFLSITDNGPGFPQEFTRNWNENNVSIHGRKGLGMHIVRDMAKAINCSLLLGNTGKGASVIISF